MNEFTNQLKLKQESFLWGPLGDDDKTQTVSHGLAVKFPQLKGGSCRARRGLPQKALLASGRKEGR